jgi:hypothetical protein
MFKTFPQQKTSITLDRHSELQAMMMQRQQQRQQ